MLYLIKSNNYLKIGYAKDIDKRMEAYNTHNPNFELLDCTSGTLNDEKMLHNLCKEYQYKNEWFYLRKEILFKWFDYVKKEEPKMSSWDYSLIGGDRTESDWVYEYALEWEEKRNDL